MIMFEKPKQVTAASGLALIGAIVAFVAAFIEFDSGSASVDGAIIIGALVLTGLMFLAISGALSAKGQWSWKMSMFVIFLTAVLIAVTFLYYRNDMAVSYLVALVQFAIILVIAVLVAGKGSSKWINMYKA